MMHRPSPSSGTCSICGKSFPLKTLVPGTTIRGPVAQTIPAAHPDWSPEGFVCRAKSDYQINLKAELEIRHLHEKVDHLLLQQWERLTQIQEIQLELLSELGRR